MTGPVTMSHYDVTRPFQQSQPKLPGDKTRSKKGREARPRVKKFKYHQYMPPEQRAASGQPAMDSCYTRLLQQQQLFLQLQILSQQQCSAYRAALPTDPGYEPPPPPLNSAGLLLHFSSTFCFLFPPGRQLMDRRVRGWQHCPVMGSQPPCWCLCPRRPPHTPTTPPPATSLERCQPNWMR